MVYQVQLRIVGQLSHDVQEEIVTVVASLGTDLVIFTVKVFMDLDIFYFNHAIIQIHLVPADDLRLRDGTHILIQETIRMDIHHTEHKDVSVAAIQRYLRHYDMESNIPRCGGEFQLNLFTLHREISRDQGTLPDGYATNYV